MKTWQQLTGIESPTAGRAFRVHDQAQRTADRPERSPNRGSRCSVHRTRCRRDGAAFSEIRQRQMMSRAIQRRRGFYDAYVSSRMLRILLRARARPDSGSLTVPPICRGSRAIRSLDRTIGIELDYLPPGSLRLWL